MHLLIRRPGGYIQRAAFGFYRDKLRSSPNDRYCLVLDESRTRLIRQYISSGQGDLMQSLSVLTADGDTTGWQLTEQGEGRIAWLPDDVEGRELPAELLHRCRQMDDSFRFMPEGELLTPVDADRLLYITSNFHDARIERLTQNEDGTLTVAIGGLWGCRVTLRFSGDVTSLVPPNEDEWDYWYTATIRMDDGFITLIDDELEEDEPLPDDPGSGYTWFRARRMTYTIEPFPNK